MSEPNSSVHDQPLVSVLMPVWNPHPRLFPEALESILNQTYQNLQIVIVEDPSERDGREMIAHVKDDRILHVSNPHRTGGLADQLNQGLQLATAELVARGDADDLWEPHRVATQVECFQKEPDLDVLGSTLNIIDDDGKHLGFRDYPRTHEEIVKALRRYCAIAHPVVMFKRDAVLKVGGYQTDFFVEDYDLWCRLAIAGAKFANHPEPLIRYRVHPEGMKSTKLKKQLGETIRMKETHFRGQMIAADRMRLLAERALMMMPSKFVLWLFGQMTFSKQLPSST
ncbi:Putative glycosyltransferase EpsE [Bremerella volcania]|uniref:Glycosyltransferase EpsE n=1 Tax=Bremerella volcania TaxID=2527984 RepID=A0A518CEE9_9BACT|nr:Putative glycosyltransferase EpsE [Bremerella volcania]